MYKARLHYFTVHPREKRDREKKEKKYQANIHSPDVSRDPACRIKIL
jgi:hypothetical protein